MFVKGEIQMGKWSVDSEILKGGDKLIEVR
jgi:hypothetical protein